MKSFIICTLQQSKNPMFSKAFQLKHQNARKTNKLSNNICLSLTNNHIDKSLDNHKISLIVKKKKKSSIQEMNNFKQVFLQQINKNNTNHERSFHSFVKKVNLKLHFSDSFSISMKIPQTFTIRKLNELASCYMKLHLKQMPSNYHVFAGLTLKNPLRKIVPSSFKNQDSNPINYIKINQEKQQVSNFFSREDGVNLAKDLIRYIIGSMIFASQCLEDLSQVVILQQHLFRIFEMENEKSDDSLIDNLKQSFAVWIRYDNIKNRSNQQLNKLIFDYSKSIYIQQEEQQQMSQQFFNRQRNQKQEFYAESQKNAHSISINKTPCLTNKIIQNANSQLLQPYDNYLQNEKSSNEIKNMIKWFQQTMVEQWVLIYEMILNYSGSDKTVEINNRNFHSPEQYSISCGSYGNKSYKNNPRLFFESIDSNTRAIPVRLLGGNKIYQLMVTQLLSQQSGNHKLLSSRWINKYLKRKDLPWSHRLRQMYYVNTQHPIYRTRMHQVIVLESQFLYQIKLTQFIQQLLENLQNFSTNSSGDDKKIQQEKEKQVQTPSTLEIAGQHIFLIYSNIISILKSQISNELFGFFLNPNIKILELFLICQNQKAVNLRYNLRFNTIKMISQPVDKSYCSESQLSFNRLLISLSEKLISQISIKISENISQKESQLLLKRFKQQVTQYQQKNFTFLHLHQFYPGFNFQIKASLFKAIYKNIKSYQQFSFQSQKKVESNLHISSKTSLINLFETKLSNYKQKLKQTASLFVNNISQSTLKLIYFYHSPKQLNLQPGNIDIFEKQTTLKKNKFTPTNSNTPTDSPQKIINQKNIIHVNSFKYSSKNKNKSSKQKSKQITDWREYFSQHPNIQRKPKFQKQLKHTKNKRHNRRQKNDK